VTDDDGALTSDTLTITVENVAPTVTAADNQTISEGATLSISDCGVLTDPGFDNPILGTAETFTFTIDWGDGTPVDAGSPTVDVVGAPGVLTECSFDGSHIYADNGIYTVTITVMDDDGGSDVGMFDVTVSNVSPSLTVVGSQTVDEGVALSVQDCGSLTDPGFDNPAMGTEETFTCSIDWDDGTLPDVGTPTVDVPGDRGVLTQCSFDASHVYADDGPYTVTVTMTDDDGGSDTRTFFVTVNNVDPEVSADILAQNVQYSDPIDDVTITATDVPTDTMNASTSYSTDGGVVFNPGLPDDALTIVGGLDFVGAVDQVGTGTWTLTGIADLSPGTYIIRVTVSDEDGGSKDVDITLNVLQEDAFVNYNGPEFVSTPSVRDNVAIVELRAVIQDITAVDPVSDSDAGNITAANVTFVYYDNGNTITIAPPIPVELLDSDIKTGIVSYEWEVDIGSSDSITFTVGIIVDRYYTRDSAVDNTLITVSKPIENSVTGGGCLVNEYSAGVFAGETGLKTNFGFNVKFNKKLTNLQGHVNIIIRQDDRVYQVKTNAMRSLVADLDTTSQALFISKANLVDITDPNNPISVAGNLSLIISLTDQGDLPDPDSIGITLWKRNELWFSSNWTGTETIEQMLAGGNLVVHGRPK
jgi:PKD repeat protein